MESSPSTLSFSDRFFSTVSTDFRHEAVPHDDFYAFLAACQALEIDLLPITWQPDLEDVGSGGQSKISQSHVNIRISFAFKRVRSDRSSVGQPSFKTLLTEISILGNDSIRLHPNIARLHGVCWEIVGEDAASILPVLVFGKSVHGDLARFMASPAGKGLSFGQRRAICGQILAGISLLHSYDVVHGDIKPHNILIFPDKNSNWRACVSDFGFSVIKSNGRGFSRFPFSTNWNAPEYHRREFSVEDAKKMDIYSCGLVCMRVLFNGILDNAIHEAANRAEVQGITQLEEQDEYATAIHILKQNDTMRHIASQLVKERKDIGSKTEHDLVEFFNLSLHNDPKQRPSLIADLIPLLIGVKGTPPLQGSDEIKPTTHSVFEISKNLYACIMAGTAVRRCIFDSLLQRVISSSCLECGGKVAFELGVCFELGLGTRRSPEMARLWISKSQQSYDDLEQLKTQMKTAQWGFKNSSEVQQNIAIGVLDPVSLTHETMGQGDNYPALRDRYLEEIEDLDASLGHCNKLSNHIRLVLANAAANQDDYALAKSLLKEVMSSPNFKAVRPDNPFAMGIFQHLASTLQGLGELEEAESVALKALGGNLETFLAPGHHMLFNIRSAGHLASIWSERGKYAQAATLHKRVSKAYARELGNNHFMTIESKVELAGALFAAGDSDAARALSLGLLVQLLGNDFNNLSTNLMDDLVLSTARFKMEMSIWVMLLCTNMGMVALEREKYIEAEWFHTSALRVSHVVLSREDSGKPQFLDTVNLLPLSRGEPLQHFPPTASRIITERPRPVVLIRASNLAMVYIDLPEYRALAEHLLRGAMEGWNLYGSHNPGLYATMGSLSMLLYNKGDFDEAESLCRQALEGRVALGGNDSVDTIECLSNLCVIKHGQKDYAAAEVLQRRVLEAREKSFGPDHPITFNSVSMLADILSQREQWDIAEPLFRKALDGFTRHFGCEHRETLKCKSMLSLQLQVLGSYAEAEILNKEALAVYERIYGSSDNETLISMNNLAVIFAEQNLYEKALPLYKEVVRRMVDSRGDEDLEALQAKMDYVAVLRYSGRYEEAMSLHRVVLEARTRILGESDAATQESMDAVRYDMPGPLCAEQL